MSPTTVILENAPPSFADIGVIDIHALGEIVADHEASDGRHIVVASSEGRHRLWLREPSPDGLLAVVIPTDQHFALRIAAATRFERKLSGFPQGYPPTQYRPTAFQRHRLCLLLILLDAEKAGASRREMASTLLYRNSAPMGRAEWKGSSQRRRTHRMIDEAKHMMAHGYRDLLLGG
jgi:hypothetical protein